MTRRVRPGDQFKITATEYNRLLGGGRCTAPQSVARWRRTTHAFAERCDRSRSQHHTQTIPIGGIVGFESATDRSDSMVPWNWPASFVTRRSKCVQARREDEHTGRVGVAIEPIAEDKVGRVVFDGVVAAQVNVTKTWHNFADVGESAGYTLQSKPDGSAQILWRRDPNGDSVCSGRSFGSVIRPIRSTLVKVPVGGIAGRQGCGRAARTATCTNSTKPARSKPVMDPAGDTVRIIARNHSAQRIRGPIEDSPKQYLEVTFDGQPILGDRPAEANASLQTNETNQSKILGHGSRTSV